MATKTIMLACAAGMSTSLLVANMQKAAAAQEKDYDIFATSTSDVDAKLKEKHPDVVMLGPQVAYMKNEVKGHTDAAGVPMDVINMMDYGMMKGDNVLKSAETLMGV
ncbi:MULTISPECIES: PTS sugar transporter subunit IIB [Leuconostoc]|uniref:PTS sugar transporter subunit IIB n=1 Tax=Leuconostoc pseudomesenteroides TaxID=33968 RepID=A0A1X0VFL0_LEUPS|nr:MULTISPECIES: PTS sugar transporter subunit IIB [Leuconostoc]KDA48941.1 PTS system, cellobiose-specific IIB component [Leuconostoc pseudomesenteroides 1159]KDA49961.1 PTS system, cellobiose-specific IIB component [Leuconostoc pseudomesenteroides PS12]CCJ67071.1 PTS system, cellobiose-specific IIB component [Leuconostoc pseudomesenteroides 4882]MCT4419839.1 PTS sugar transporter subunit IIB [Leuconostoc falkenbergense]MDG9744157.1 PTS sugar transporter subunit IIB [Leuconostoc falkenbergense